MQAQKANIEELHTCGRARVMSVSASIAVLGGRSDYQRVQRMRKRANDNCLAAVCYLLPRNTRLYSVL